MIHLFKVTFIGSASVVIFDVIASYASLFFEFPYAYATVGSLLIYAAVGYSACKSSSFWPGVLVAAFMGVVDSTVGWYVSWEIGPGALQDVELTPRLFLGAAAFVVAIATGSGFLGAGVAKLASRR